MKKPTVIYLVRHGQSATNLAGVIGGQSNPELTEKGRKQAAATKADLTDIKFDAIYSSDLQRAVDTAAIISGKPVSLNHQLTELRERDYGSLEGKPDHHFKGYMTALLALPKHERWAYKHVEDMENDDELVYRFMNALKTIAEQNNGKTILVVAHGAAIRTVLFKLGFGHYEDMPPKSFKNGGYVELEHGDGRFSIKRVEGIDQKVVDDNRK